MTTLSLGRPPIRLLALAAIAAATAAVAFVWTPRAAAGDGGGRQVSAGAGLSIGALVSLGPISIVDGAVTVTGTIDAKAVVGDAAKASTATATVGATNATVSAQATASAAANVSLTVNNEPVAVEANGGFKATVPVGDRPVVRVQAASLVSGEVFVTTIPVAAIPTGGTPVDALATLDAAGVTLLMPPEGLTCIDGLPAPVTLDVADAKLLATLEINGTNLLGRTTSPTTSTASTARASTSKSTKRTRSRRTTPRAPGNNGVRSAAGGRLVFTHEVAASSRSVEIAVEDANGVSQVSTFPLRKVTSVIRIGRMSSVAASGARGIRVSAVHFVTSPVATRHRLLVQVTLRDRRNYLVRGAVVLVRGLAHRTSISGQFAAITDARGAARLVLPLTAQVLGKRLYVEVLARTPAASARVKASIVLPAALVA